MIVIYSNIKSNVLRNIDRTQYSKSNCELRRKDFSTIFFLLISYITSLLSLLKIFQSKWQVFYTEKESSINSIKWYVQHDHENFCSRQLLNVRSLYQFEQSKTLKIQWEDRFSLKNSIHSVLSLCRRSWGSVKELLGHIKV